VAVAAMPLPRTRTSRDHLDEDLVFDGELVALGERVRPDFGLLQQRMRVTNSPAALLAEVPVLIVIMVASSVAKSCVNG
jgi:ATP-dependent DNA ligase